METETPLETPLKLEEGKRYNTRDGKITGPLMKAPDGGHHSYAFAGYLAAHKDDTAPWRSWTEEGLEHSNNANGPLDLISEFIEPEPEVNPAPPKLRLEIGKRYVTRQGSVTGPLRPIDARYYPFVGALSDVCCGQASWTPNGHFYSSRVDHPNDLVAEYVEAPARRKQLELKKGGRYITRGGSVTSPLQVNPYNIDVRPFMGTVDNGAGGYDQVDWTPNGNVYAAGCDNVHDLVAEYPGAELAQLHAEIEELTEERDALRRDERFSREVRRNWALLSEVTSQYYDTQGGDKVLEVALEVIRDAGLTQSKLNNIQRIVEAEHSTLGRL